MNLPVAVVGEGVIDRFVTSDGHLDVIGGSPLNTAVALRRAGVEVHWWGRMSSGPEGDALIHYAKTNDVLGGGVRIVDAPATIVTVELNEAGLPTYGFQLEGSADWGWSTTELAGLESYSVIQIGSLGAVLEPGSSALLSTLKKLKGQANSPLISYDPNARPKAAADEREASRVRARVEEFVALADLVKVSDEDLEWLHPGCDPAQSAAEWSVRGPRLVVMTRGAAGAVAFVDGQICADIPGVHTKVIDTVGAGDTFMAWLLRGVVSDFGATLPTDAADITRLLEQAAAAAAITCSRAGCNPPLLADVL